MIHRFLLQKNDGNLDTKNHRGVYMLFLLIMPTTFLFLNNAILRDLESLKEKIIFHDLSYILKYNLDIFFIFNINNIKSNSYIIFLKFFTIIFFWWKIFSLPVILINKRFNFCYFFKIFPISSWLNAIYSVNMIYSILHLFYWKDLLMVSFLYSTWQISI